MEGATLRVASSIQVLDKSPCSLMSTKGGASQDANSLYERLHSTRVERGPLTPSLTSSLTPSVFPNVNMNTTWRSRAPLCMNAYIILGLHLGVEGSF